MSEHHESSGPAGSHGPEVPPPLSPPDPPMVPFAAGGIALWLVLVIVFVPLHGWLKDHGHENWLWISIAGVICGIPGLLTMMRHDAHRRRRRATSQAPLPPPR